MKNVISDIINRLKEVNEIVTSGDVCTMTFEQAYTIAAFYDDFLDSNNRLIENAETLAEEDPRKLSELSELLKKETKVLLDNMGRLETVDFQNIAQTHSRQYYSFFQKASDELNPFWKRYCELNNRLDYLPAGSEDYVKTEKECNKAKAEHDTHEIQVKKLYIEYEKENLRSGDVFFLKVSHLYALVAKINGIAESIIYDLDHLEKGDGQ